jgi:hypothetical protein
MPTQPDDLPGTAVTRTGFLGLFAFSLSPLVGVSAKRAHAGPAGTRADKGYVNHGNAASTPRPAGYVSVEWIGSVEPANAVDGDTWVNTA